MATIDNEVKITINLSELVNIRSVVLDLDNDEFSLEDIEQVANELRTTLSWDTLYGMVDESILKYVDKLETHYGEICKDLGQILCVFMVFLYLRVLRTPPSASQRVLQVLSFCPKCTCQMQKVVRSTLLRH